MPPRKAAGSSSAPVSRASAAGARPYPQPTAAAARKSARSTAGKRVKYTDAAASAEGNYQAEDSMMLLLGEGEGEDDEEEEVAAADETPVAQQKRGAKADKELQSSYIKRATRAVMAVTAEKQATDAAEYATKLKSVIAAGQAGANQVVDAAQLKMEQKLEQFTTAKAQRFTLVGQPEQYRHVALRLDEYARRLAGSLQKYNLKLLDPDDDLHQAIAQVFATRVERTHREQRKLSKVIAETAADYYDAAQSADGAYHELRKHLKRAARV